MDMRFGTCKIRSLYRTGSLKTVAKELGKYKLHLVGLHEVRWERMALKGQRIIHFSTDRGMGIIS
jgi:hypothetical protein